MGFRDPSQSSRAQATPGTSGLGAARSLWAFCVGTRRPLTASCWGGQIVDETGRVWARISLDPLAHPHQQVILLMYRVIAHTGEVCSTGRHI